MRGMFEPAAVRAYGPLDKIPATGLDRLAREGAQGLGLSWRPMRRSSAALRRPVPGPLFEWVKRASWVELAIFTALIAFWLLPGFETETFIFGLVHGIGYILLCLLIWVAAVRREAPYTLLAATLTPVGPLGSVIAIELIERKGWGVAAGGEEPAIDA
jgi:hypothetical protein